MNQSGTDRKVICFQLSSTEVYTQLLRLIFRTKYNVYLMITMSLGVSLIILSGETLWGLPFVIFPPVFIFLVRRSIKKLIKQHPEFLEEQSLSFDVDGITISNSTVTVQWPWSRVKEISDSGDFLLVRIDQFGSGGILPKSALSPQEQQQLLAYAQRD